MQLDADLGIDSIKRVEILSALQDRLPGLPPLQPEQLGSFRSLRAIVEFIGQAQATDGLGYDAGRENFEPGSGSYGRPGAGVAGDRRREDRLSRRDARARHAARRRPRHRLDQAGRDLLGHPGPATRRLAARGPEEIGTLGTLRDIVAFLGRTRCRADGLLSLRSESNGDCGAERLDRRRPDRAGSCSKRWPRRRAIPIDMLELDMRLDADLGIDSIKRVEILSAVQDRLPEAADSRPGATGHAGNARADRRVARRPHPAPAPHCRPLPSAGRPASIDGHGDDESGSRSKRRARTGLPSPPANGEWRSPSPWPVVLRKLHPRAVRHWTRPTVARWSSFRAGGTVWITDDGSPLTEALRSGLLERGLPAAGDPARGLGGDPPPSEASVRLDRPRVPATGFADTFIARCVSDRSRGGPGPGTVRRSRRRGVPDRLAAGWDRSASTGLAGDASPASGGAGRDWPRRPAANGRRSIARRSTSTAAFDVARGRPRP